jgi:hypothetical protein
VSTARPNAQILAPTNGSTTRIAHTARPNAQILAPTNGSTTGICDCAPVVVGAGRGRDGNGYERGSQHRTSGHAEADSGAATTTPLDGADTTVVEIHACLHIHGWLDRYVTDCPRHGSPATD